MVLKAVVLLCVVGVSQGCSTSLINYIFQMLSSPPTTMKPTTMKPTTMKPTTMKPNGTTSGSCDCGKPNRVTRIVNGVETEKNEYPWQVGLAKSVAHIPSCGGTIISANSVMTAAHCTEGKSPADIVVVAGEHNAWVDGDEEFLTVCKINDHPNYDSSTTDYDYSILTLCTPITFSKEISPACLPEQGLGTIFENKDHVVSGWGATSSGGPSSQYLLETTVKSMSNSACCSSPNKYSCSDITYYMFCAGNPDTDSCQGDSGGPLVYWQNNANYVLTGVVSWGYGCAGEGYPGVYARVSKVMDWVTATDSSTTQNICPMF